MKWSPSTLAAGVALIVPATIGLLLTGVPTLTCPMPLLTIVPGFLMGNLYWLAILLPSLLFFAWNRQLSREEKQIPKRSLVLLALLTALSVAYFATGWGHG